MNVDTVCQLVVLGEYDLAKEALDELARVTDIEDRVNAALAAHEAGLGEPS